MSAAAPPGGLARASLLACGLMVSAPFVVPTGGYPLPSFRGELAAVVLGLLALLLFAAGRSWRELRLPASALVPLGLALVLLVQFYSGRTARPQLAAIALGYLAWSACLAALGASLAAAFGRERVCRVLGWFVLAAGVALALLALAQVLGGPRSVFGALPQRASASLGQANHVASGVALGLASALWLLGTGALPALAAAALGALLLSALSLTGSRSAWLYLAAFLALAAWVWLKRRDPGSRRLLAAAAALVPLFAGLQWALGAVWPEAETERLFDTVSGMAQRLRLWHEAWILFLDAPLSGVGHGNFAWRHFLLASALPGGAAVDGVYTHAHNLFLHLLAELGLPGFLVLAVGLGFWLAGFLPRLAEDGGWWLSALLAVLLLHSMLEFPLWYAYFLGLASLLLGVADARVLRPPATRMLMLGRFGVAAGALLAALAAAMLYQSYRELTDAFARLDARARGGTAAEAARLRESLFDLHERSLLAPYVEVRLAGLLPLDRQQLEQKLALNGSVERLWPSHGVAYRQAVLLALKGEAEASVAQLERAAAAHPAYLRQFVPALRRLAEAEPVLAPLLAAAEARLGRG